MPANLVHVPLSSGQAPAGTAQAGAPPPPPAAAGGEQPPPPQQQQFVPATSQYAGNQAAPPPQHMWTPQVGNICGIYLYILCIKDAFLCVLFLAIALSDEIRCL